MKNVTISLDEGLALWVRVSAAEHDMSLSRFVAELLRERRAREEGYSLAMESYLGRSPRRLRRSESQGYPTRDEIHDR